MIRRVPLRRGPWRKPKGRMLRTGELPPLPQDWLKRCLRVRERDEDRCRFCGFLSLGREGQVDHLIPRRLADPDWRDAPDNLALLCVLHHVQKTHAETRLFQGNSYPFDRMLDTIRRAATRPLPTPAQLARAFGRLTRLLQEDQA